MSTGHHIVLLGDSVFDNARYVEPGASVSELLGARLRGSGAVTLLARDGSLAGDVATTIRGVPRSATHLALSAGGNDALSSASLLRASAATIADAFDLVGKAVEAFRAGYEPLLHTLATLERPIAVCTIYDSVPGIGRAERTALAVYNDAITRTALKAGAHVIDLRDIFTQPEDYAAVSPIEPSAAGGAKLAGTIAEWSSRQIT